MTTTTTYRIEQLDRDGNITKYIDNLRDKPITLPLAEKYIDLARAIEPDAYAAGDLDWRAVEIEPDPIAFAEQWMQPAAYVYPASGAQLAACADLLADRLRGLVFPVPVYMTVNISPRSSSSYTEADKVATVDLISEALGTYAVPHQMSSGVWHHTTCHRPDSLHSVQVYDSIEAPPAESVDYFAAPERPVHADGIGDAPTSVPDAVTPERKFAHARTVYIWNLSELANGIDITRDGDDEIIGFALLGGVEVELVGDVWTQVTR